MKASTPTQLGTVCLFLLQTVFAAPSEIGVISDIFEVASEDSPEIEKSDLYHVSQLHKATCHANSLRGEAFISQELISTIKRKVGIFSARHPKKELEQSGAFVATKLLTETSQVHTDHHEASGQLVGEDTEIGFVILNSNPDAFFKFGETEIPIVKNTLVHFKGRYPHNTVINSGEVKLLGPFQIFSAWGTSTKNFAVGMACPCQKQVCKDDYYIAAELSNHDGNNGLCEDGFEETQSAAECEAASNDIAECSGVELKFHLVENFACPFGVCRHGGGCTLDLNHRSMFWNKDEGEKYGSVYPICKKIASPSGAPTVSPTSTPSSSPTSSPTTKAPTVSPTSMPSISPTSSPTTKANSLNLSTSLPTMKKKKGKKTKKNKKSKETKSPQAVVLGAV